MGRADADEEGDVDGEAEAERDAAEVALAELDRKVTVAEGEPEGEAVAEGEPDDVVEPVFVGDTEDVAEGRAEVDDDLVPDVDAVEVKGVHPAPENVPHEPSAFRLYVAPVPEYNAAHESVNALLPNH